MSWQPESAYGDRDASRPAAAQPAPEWVAPGGAPSAAAGSAQSWPAQSGPGSAQQPQPQQQAWPQQPASHPPASPIPPQQYPQYGQPPVQPFPPQPFPQYGQQPYLQPYGAAPTMYPAPMMYPAPVAFRPPPRPPLTRELNRAAARAGMLGFGAITLGWNLLSIGAVALGFLGLIYWAASSSGDLGSFVTLAHYFDRQTGGMLLPLSIGFTVLGVVLWVGGVIVSRLLLRRAGHPKPGGVTWAGIGIGVGISAIIVQPVTWGVVQAALVSSYSSIDTAAPSSLDPGILGRAFIALGVDVLVVVGVSVVIGWLCWWWMAHAMRPEAPKPPAPSGPLLPGLAPERGPWDPPAKRESATGY
ncbi:hypothetical protein [Schumannella soli]|uniref:Uncharacterized protein n=1 Tax=Schumannella soli TaxID=2590779 RepID=A0A506Y6M3_9MICO|nr:hypothetical protein [Schumannella soli]TPW77682.1 hypothetical protein FJ657_03220 [Schumannella soli]